MAKCDICGVFHENEKCKYDDLIKIINIQKFKIEIMRIHGNRLKDSLSKILIFFNAEYNSSVIHTLIAEWKEYSK